MGGNQEDFDHQQARKKKEGVRKEMEESNKWKKVKLGYLLGDESFIWVKTNETKVMCETFIGEKYGMQSWFRKASEGAVKKSVAKAFTDEPWVDEVRWSKP